MGKAKATVFKDEAGEFRFRVKSGNGEIIVASEGYTRKGDAVIGYDTLKRVMASGPDFSIEEDQT